MLNVVILSVVLLNVVMLIVVMLKFVDECRYAECHYAECRGEFFLPRSPLFLNLFEDLSRRLKESIYVKTSLHVRFEILRFFCKSQILLALLEQVKSIRYIFFHFKIIATKELLSHS